MSRRQESGRFARENGLISSVNDSDEKLEWIYKNSNKSINREEYQLGHAVDKSFETLLAEEKQQQQKSMIGLKQPLNYVEHDVVPFSIRSYKNLQSTEQICSAIMEDPLMLVKQRELESRYKILENPQLTKDFQKKVKNQQKKKKSSRSKHTNVDGDSDLDNKFTKILRNGLRGKDNDLTKLLDAKFETVSKELDRVAQWLLQLHPEPIYYKTRIFPPIYQQQNWLRKQHVKGILIISNQIYSYTCNLCMESCGSFAITILSLNIYVRTYQQQIFLRDKMNSTCLKLVEKS
uniref:Uncharacterized protein n=1 Tax=Glossina brevipalpis TaxID=37001 RepID=A0A1A9WFZ5_9MUSC